MPIYRKDPPTPSKFIKNKIYQKSDRNLKQNIILFNNTFPNFELTKEYLKTNHLNILSWINDTYKNDNTIKEKLRCLGKLFELVNLKKLSEKYYDQRNELSNKMIVIQQSQEH